MFTSQIYPYLQKHSGVPWTKIATLKRAFFVEPLRGGWWSEPPGIKCYNTGGNGYRCLSGTNPTSLASADLLDFAFCDFKLLLRMQSLDSVNVISQARISLRREVARLFDKLTRIKWLVEVDYRRKTLLKTIGKGGELLEILLFISLNNAAFIDFSLWIEWQLKLVEWHLGQPWVHKIMKTSGITHYFFQTYWYQYQEYRTRNAGACIRKEEYTSPALPIYCQSKRRFHLP